MEVIVSLTPEEIGLIIRSMTYYHPIENCDGVVTKLFRTAKPYLEEAYLRAVSPTQEETK